MHQYAIEKYRNVDEINQEFMDLWFRKTHVLDNIKCLLGLESIGEMISVDNKNHNNHLIYSVAKQKQRIDMIKEFINMMGFNLDNIGNEYVLCRDDFIFNMELSIKECKIFTDPKKFESLFGYKMKRIKSVKAFLGSVNTLLKIWGIYISSHTTRITDKKTKHRPYILSYELEYYQNINIYF
jgi:hypothetical protein